MKRCEKCDKLLGEYFHTAYGEDRCEDCWDDYLMTDRGKVEYLIGICHDDYPASDFDAEFLGWVASCWKKYRNELELSMSEVVEIEAKARALGLL